MPKLKPGTVRPTPEEAERIRAGIEADPDARELDAEDFKRMRPASETHPHIVERHRRRQRAKPRKP